MPNWSSNIIRASGSQTARDALEKWVKNPAADTRERCVEQIRLFLLLGYAGYLKPTRAPRDPILAQFYPFGIAERYSVADSSYAEVLDCLDERPDRGPYPYSRDQQNAVVLSAFTELSAPAPFPDDKTLRLTPDVERKINNLFYQSDLHLLDATCLTVDQYYRLEDAWSLIGYDWEYYTEKDNPLRDELQLERHVGGATEFGEGRGADFRTVVYPFLLAEVFGYNLSQGRPFCYAEQMSGYSSYAYQYGIKWPNLSYPTVESNERGVIELLGDTPWAPPHPDIYKQLKDHFGLKSITVRAVDEFDHETYDVYIDGLVRRDRKVK